MAGVMEPDKQTDMAVMLERARRQQDDAVIALIERCQSRIVAAIEIAGVPRYDADFDDAQNQALLEIWRAFPTLQKNESVCFWMHGLTRRVTASRFIDSAVRRRRRSERYGTQVVASAAPEAGPGDRIADRDLLGRVLEGLSAEHREVLVLRYLEGFSEEETAKLLSIPTKTVSSRTSRAKRAAMDLINTLEGDAA